MLKANILGKDKQEKVNSIVVLAKLLDCISGAPDAVSNDFTAVLDFQLFVTLFSIVSANMLTETYKAILKILVIAISGSVFRTKDELIDRYAQLYEALIEHLDVIDIVTSKLYLSDNKITYNLIKLVTDLINRALKFNHNPIITLAGRLKHVTFFSTVGNLIETEDRGILDGIVALKAAYFNLNEYLNDTTFDLSIKSHQTMLTNLFIFLDVSLNEYGTPATTEEYVKAGFTDNPRKFVVDNFTVLLAMDLKIFLKDPNFTFKKRFHEELMMSDHSRTFPLYLFIERATELWMRIFHQTTRYPHIYASILSWELMIYYTMNNCLILWQETRAQLENPTDVLGILELVSTHIDNLERDLASGSKSVEEALDVTATQLGADMRHQQVELHKKKHLSRWQPRLHDFSRSLEADVLDFVCEQRVIQLLKGLWVYTELHGEYLLKSRDRKLNYRYYFILLAPNRKSVYYKEFVDKPIHTPLFEEMEAQAVVLTDILEFRLAKMGEHVGEEDKKNSDRLVSIRGTILYEKITLVGDGGRRLLSFYTDTQVNKYVWLDGLKMLKGIVAPGQLSEETQKQIDLLVDIRRNTQLLSLETKKAGGELPDDVEISLEVEDEDDDDEFYDMVELASVADDYHYR